MPWQTPKTNWAAGNVPTADDFNRIEENINYIEQEDRTPDQSVTPVASGPLQSILNFFAALLKSVTGKANWYELPAKSMEQLNSDLTAHLADDTKHVTKDGTLQTGLNADQVDGEDSSTLKVNARALSTAKLVAEVSSSAPSSPVNGQIWYDSLNHKFKGYANGAWV